MKRKVFVQNRWLPRSLIDAKHGLVSPFAVIELYELIAMKILLGVMNSSPMWISRFDMILKIWR